MPNTVITPNSRQAAQAYEGDRPIVFFDGECLLCNGFVDLLLQIDTANTLYIAALQGQTAAKYLPPLPTEPEDWSVFYLNHTGLYSQSEAFVAICRHLGGPWVLFGLIDLVPRFMRNAIYRVIARNRYRWFGRRPTCRMPTEQEQERFLP